MRYGILVIGLLVLGLGESAHGQGGKKEKKLTSLVELGKLKSKAPDSWKPEKPANLLRLYQFRLPRQGDDSADGELTILEMSGTVETNHKRFKDMIEPPAGKSIDDATKMEKFKLGSADCTLVDISGTYLYKVKPIDPQPSERRPDHRLLGVTIQHESDAFKIQLIGPRNTIAHHEKAFRDWLKAFQ